MRRRSLVHFTSAVVLLAGSLTLLASQSGREGFKGFWGAKFRGERHRKVPRPRPPRPSTQALERLHHWNSIAVDASGLDHTPVAEGEDRNFGEQLGPGRASRAIAIVHLAIYEAVNAIDGGHQSLTALDRAPKNASIDAAIAQAAYDTLVEVFPSQSAIMRGHMRDELAALPRYGLVQGLSIGRKAARAVLKLAAGDGSAHAEPRLGIDFFSSTEPGKWRQDPISKVPLAMGAHWGEVKPFVLESAAQFRVPPPPALDSPEYAVAFEEVKRLGGDGAGTLTERTTDQTQAGIYWAYDGTPSLCAPPRLYNQIVLNIADQMGTDVVDLARLLALVNLAMSDAGIAIWESKYFYQVARPVTAIREAETDGNDTTTGDANFSPLGAPASNLDGPNFTPPFPAYPSGHAGFGGAVFEMLRRFYGTDDIPFTFVSDEYNGETLDNKGKIRPLLPRSFKSLSEAEEENGQSRIYLGIHWSFDKTAGIEQGRQVASYVFEHALR
jgi:PAP2 superfamily